MLNLINTVFNFLFNCSVELIFYILVDVVVKSSLKEARDDDLEKRQIWLYESLVLIFGTLSVYLFHHTPYILFFLSVTTLVYTQLLGRINFRYWWVQVNTRWDEFQQHEESMEHYQEMQNRKPTVSPNVVATQSSWVPPTVTMPASAGFTFDPNSIEPWYPSDKSNSAVSKVPPSSHNLPPNVTHSTYLRQRFSATPNFQAPQPIYSSSPMVANRGISRSPELTRKPLHSNMPSPIYNHIESKSHSQRIQSAIKNGMKAVFGLNPTEPHPSGLSNRGENICFMNSVLQCLAQTPRLGICLNKDVNTIKCSVSESAMVFATAELIHHMTKLVDGSTLAILDHTALRKAASQMRGSVIVDPKSDIQYQQDCAEFLMWFLDCLHNALNLYRADATGNSYSASTGVRTKYQNVTLQMLRFVYGDLSADEIMDSKKSCRAEIESADSLNSNSYAEPIQRLSDLEWLTYKDGNNSIIDDIFTGQLVESQRCLSCNRISVSIQPFSILPVPIVEPRQLNGLVYLEDCFTKYGMTEDLFGPEGLRCQCCNKINMKLNNAQTVPGYLQNNNNGNYVSNAKPEAFSASPILSNGGVHNKDKQRLLQQHLHQNIASNNSSSNCNFAPEPSAAMSPITSTGVSPEVMNDSGFQDNQMRTSTPIHSTGGSLLKLTDGQRRSLLRQLPDCLIVQLMRFSQHFGELRKLRKPVSVPLNALDLTDLIIDNVMHRENLSGSHTSHKYDLYGVCVHLGGEIMSGGHYIAFVKMLSGQWYRFDDESVVLVNMDYELTTKLVRENAYLLFYKKCTI